MKKYLALYMMPVAALDGMMARMKQDPNAGKNDMTAWQTWMNAHKNMFVEMGSPVGKNMRVTSKSASPMRNEVTGYSIIEANSHEEAAKLFMDNPMLVGMPEAYVEVLEFTDMGSM